MWCVDALETVNFSSPFLRSSIKLVELLRLLFNTFWATLMIARIILIKVVIGDNVGTIKSG